MLVYLYCDNCHHEWLSTAEKKGEQCPHCSTFVLYKPFQNKSDNLAIRCKICKNEWIAAEDSIIQECPKCNSIAWEYTDIPIFRCLWCHYQWVNEKVEPYKQCPSCKRKLWDQQPIQIRSTAYTDQCFLCGRELHGRGTKDKYALDQITLVKEISDEDLTQHVFGVVVCRSMKKCGEPELLKKLRTLTGRYDYSEPW